MRGDGLPPSIPDMEWFFRDRGELEDIETGVPVPCGRWRGWPSAKVSFRNVGNYEDAKRDIGAGGPFYWAVYTK